MQRPDYSRIEFRRLREVGPSAILDLMNDPDIRRHLPLARGAFGMPEYQRFIAAKDQVWVENGYGPWAFTLHGDLVGWGGPQPEGDDVDIALVLHRSHWGAGRVLYPWMVEHAFAELHVASVITLLPPSRTRVRALSRLGFEDDGQVVLGGIGFNRYRLTSADWRSGQRRVTTSLNRSLPHTY